MAERPVMEDLPTLSCAERQVDECAATGGAALSTAEGWGNLNTELQFSRGKKLRF